MSTPRVLDVGQCDYDHPRISALLRSQFGAEVVQVHSATEAIQRLKNEAFDLVLVNRVFDRTAEEGLDLIRKVKADAKAGAVPVMLVSNFPESQAEAVAAGAVPGFGKAALAEVGTREKLEKVLGGVGVG
jgi:CheY-like chemotaxis protein